MAGPAAEFGALIHARLAGRPITPPADAAPAMPPVPRLPAANHMQGSSALAGPPPPNPVDLLEDALRSACRGTGDGGWRQII